MNFFNLMNKYKYNKSTNNNDDYTHVSMLPHGGLYKIPNEELEEFYGQYNKCIKDGAKFGILERPKDVGPMLVDVDIAKKSDQLQKLYTRERTIEYAKCFQKHLLENTSLDSVDCWIFEKKAYLDGKGNCKNGFHLHFPTVWMTKAHRKFITNLDKNTNIEKEFETLDDSAVRNNWLLYGSRKTADQHPYKVTYIVKTDGTLQRKRSSSIHIRTLSIRNNQSKITTSILEKCLPKEFKQNKPKGDPQNIDDGLITRCMESLDPSRADDYHKWIKIGCILYTIDKENGYQRWDGFSKQSYKYDEDYLYKIWSHFRDYNYTVGSLIFLAKEDDPQFTVSPKPNEKRLITTEPVDRVYTWRKLMKMCKERGIRNVSLLTFDEVCDVLDIPRQKKDEKFEKNSKNMRTSAKKITLTNTTTGDTHNFKSIYAAGKFLGRNPGSVYTNRNLGRSLISKHDNHEYKIQ